MSAPDSLSAVLHYTEQTFPMVADQQDSQLPIGHSTFLEKDLKTLKLIQASDI